METLRPLIGHLAGGALRTVKVTAGRSPDGRLGLDTLGLTTDHVTRGVLGTMDIMAGWRVVDTLWPPIGHLAPGALGTVDIMAGRPPWDFLVWTH